jgi:hypothetical protein
MSVRLLKCDCVLQESSFVAVFGRSLRDLLAYLEPAASVQRNHRQGQRRKASERPGLSGRLGVSLVTPGLDRRGAFGLQIKSKVQDGADRNIRPTPSAPHSAGYREATVPNTKPLVHGVFGGVAVAGDDIDFYVFAFLILHF